MNPSIEETTDLIPEVIADNIAAEARSFTRAVPADAPIFLAARARRHWANNPHFRLKLCRPDGREILYAFMRHWLAAHMLDTGTPRAEIPERWSNGGAP